MNELSRRTAKRRKKFSFIQAVRLIIQIVFFVFLPALYINAFLELKLVFESIANGTFDIGSLIPQSIELIAVIPVTILLGRFFCGWMCAFGAFGDFIYSLFKKIFKTSFQMNQNADRALKIVKYGMLVFVVIFLWTYDIPALHSASPWDVFGMLATVGAAPAFAYVAANLTVGFIFFILIILGSIFVQRFFCRYLCPLGAVFSIFSAFKITKIVKPSAKCGKCRICTENCAMGIPLYNKDTVHTGECIECLQCVAACPRKNVSYSLAGSDIRPLVAGTMAAIVITGIYGSTNLAFAAAKDTASESATVQIVDESSESVSTSVLIPLSSTENIPASSAAASAEPSPSAAETKAPSASASSGYADGTYTGSGTGFRGATTEVSVTIQNGEITDVTTIAHGDDRPYYDSAYDSVANDIISSQSSEVDAVSGATYSSIGIMEAVQNALDQASA